MMQLSFLPWLVLRAPTRPFTGTPLTAEDLDRLIKDTAFMDALWLASPDLYEDALRWQRGDTRTGRKHRKLVNALVKYHSRMHTRPTPFGLFAGCAVLRWGNATDIVLSPGSNRKYLRPDMDMLGALGQQLTGHPLIRRHLDYRINNSAYIKGNELRYFEYQTESGQRKYQLSAVELTPPLHFLLETCRTGPVPFARLASQLAQREQLPYADISGFLDELISAQLLVSHLAIQLTGPGYLPRIISILETACKATADGEVQQMLDRLRDLQQRLDACGEDNAAPLVPALQEMTARVKALNVPFQPARLFQADCRLGTIGNSLDSALQEQLRDSLEALRILGSDAPGSPWLRNFKQAFTEKFDTAPVPLCDATDPDTGILHDKSQYLVDFGDDGLNRLNAFISPDSPDGGAPADDHPVKTWMRETLIGAFKTGQHTVHLSDEELARLRTGVQLRPLPDTFSVVFRLTGRPEAPVFIESAGGISGTSLIARFGHTDPAFLSCLKAVDRFEAARNPDCCHAGVVHLPEDRTGNVLQHPPIRDFEIPYLAGSSYPPDRQLAVAGLYLQVVNDELRLFSPALKRFVVPHIDHAHNFTYNTLPVYRLLGELQGQNRQTTLSFSWRVKLPGIRFYPRLQYKNTLLSLAQWKLEAADFQLLTDAAPGKEPEAFAAFCKQWNLPPLFSLADNDQELLVSQADTYQVQAFAAAIRGRSRITLKEFLSPEGCPVKDRSGNPYAHQIIAIAGNEAPAAEPLPPVPDLSALPRRAFPPGSEWLYFKLYCNPSAAGILLTRALAPLCEALEQEGLTDKWFFIRYRDTQEHLRLRFHLTDTAHTGTVISRLHDSCHPAEAEGQIWKIQTDTYFRETERYGYDLMPLMESLFHADSRYVIRALSHPGNTALLLPAALKFTDNLLERWGFSLDEKTDFAARMKAAYNREFGPGTPEKKLFNQYYRAHAATLGEWLEGRAADGQPLLQWLREYDGQQAALFGQIPPGHAVREPETRFRLLGSMIHMHFNRLFATEQRRHEMIAYNTLHACYRAMQGRRQAAQAR
ncbi:lantibiotic dehydratase [Compostibacter hankyongensis]|uniref:Lantibiotic dehydratase n=1 Tax=Compostibacter hankyongensis TaxID=1007089 RepID=A0ABP8FTU4_9BACT